MRVGENDKDAAFVAKSRATVYLAQNAIELTFSPKNFAARVQLSAIHRQLGWLRREPGLLGRHFDRRVRHSSRSAIKETQMEYLIGTLLALGVGGFATAIGFDRARAFYPTVLLVVASYYDLFAVMGGSTHALRFETLVFCGFAAFSVLGFKTNPWLIVAALLAHGGMDLVHGRIIANPGVPDWWPGFCSSYDFAAGAYLAVRLHLASQAAGRQRLDNEFRAGAPATYGLK